MRTATKGIGNRNDNAGFPSASGARGPPTGQPGAGIGDAGVVVRCSSTHALNCDKLRKEE